MVFSTIPTAQWNREANAALSMGRPGFNRTQPSGSALASVFMPFHTPIMEMPSGLAVKMAAMVLKSNTGAI